MLFALKNHNKAFTLVELLVVIAIVGLLSTIVLAVTSGVSEQGRIAKSLQFSKHLENALGSNLAGRWNLDEGTGVTARDSSGWNNNGVITGAIYTNDTPSDYGYALDFDGLDYVQIANHNSLVLDSAITVEAWVNARSLSGNTTNQYRIINKFSYPNNGWYLRYHNSFIFSTYDGSGHNASYSITPTLNTWHHVVGVSDGTNNLVYVDGVSGNSVETGVLTNSSSVLEISSSSGDYDWNGFIDEVKIYSVALTASQIKSQYLVGLNELLIKGLITEQEHLKRLAL
jgi:prepilin-type N-terminal cleavage/methylation domain-containing protein